MTREHYVNGRILLRPRGGVHRFTQEIADRLPAATVLRPEAAARGWNGRLWEQTSLYRASADGVLLNTAHSGPLRHRRAVAVVHDLFALTQPRLVHPAYAALHRAMLPRLVTGAAQVVAPSRKVADEIATTFPSLTRQVEVVSPGISEIFGHRARTAGRSRLDLRHDQPVVAALLDPTPRKRSDLVAGVLQQLRRDRDDVQVIVAGARRPASFAQAARGPSVIDRSGFQDLGAASDIELAAMYQAADIFFALSSGEGFGLPMAEAAMCGAVVVTTPVPSIEDFCADGAVIVRDAAEGLRAIQRLLDDPAHRQALSDVAADRLGDLRWGQTAATLEGIMVDVGTI